MLLLCSYSSPDLLLSASSITVSNLHKFDYACKHFFAYKEITPDDRVGRIIYSFESPLVGMCGSAACQNNVDGNQPKMQPPLP
ncbi:hypothetical protein L208DRAFT_340873 [Tricholoma matsutake]|nr:hypothetical protein L208DRAFT_340873 [Tricholoma matsutake 945]